MPSDPVKPPPDAAGPTRRAVLRAAAATVALRAFPTALADDDGPAAPTQPAPSALPWLATPRSRVVEMRCPDVIRNGGVDARVVGGMIARGVCLLTKTEDVREAWRNILGDAKRIVIKFNHVGETVLSTSEALADALVGSLDSAGYARDRLFIAELGEHAIQRLGVRPVARGWGGSIDLDGRQEQLAQYLYDADAILNAPFLKTHQIAGMSCSMKNLSHALVRRPALYHADGCAPFAGRVVASEPVASRLKLNLVNALRTVFRRGPEAREDDVYDARTLLFGFDPVAVDAVGLDLLTLQRREMGLTEELRIPTLASAAREGLGRREESGIERFSATFRA